MERKVVCHDRVKPAFVFKDLLKPYLILSDSAESSHRHPVTTNMQTTKIRWSPQNVLVVYRSIAIDVMPNPAIEQPVIACL
ncbi:hypothetical protein TNCV_550511 [Trichonephila clavipes]|nr:hypothetical protein TNCV_550511 [Trichonephila clavipes]